MTDYGTCTPCGAARELTAVEYLRELMASDNREQEYIDRICNRVITLYEQEQKYKDDSMQGMNEEIEKLRALANSYSAVLKDVIRFNTRWD